MHARIRTIGFSGFDRIKKIGDAKKNIEEIISSDPKIKTIEGNNVVCMSVVDQKNPSVNPFSMTFA